MLNLYLYDFGVFNSFISKIKVYLNCWKLKRATCTWAKFFRVPNIIIKTIEKIINCNILLEVSPKDSLVVKNHCLCGSIFFNSNIKKRLITIPIRLNTVSI